MCVCGLFGGLSLEDNGNYTCEISGPHNALLGFVTHKIFVRGMLMFVNCVLIYKTRSRQRVRIVSAQSAPER